MEKTSDQVNDYSRKAIRREVVREGLTHWLTLYPTAVGIPIGLAGFLFHMPVLYFGLVGTLTLSLASAIIHVFFREETIGARYLERLSKKIKAEETRALASLQEDLQACRQQVVGGEHAVQATEQFARLQRKYENVRIVLDKKLQRGELTYGRFIGAAEQVYLRGLENLKQLVVVLQSLSSIDTEYIRTRLDILNMKTKRDSADVKEQETLHNRITLMENQLALVNQLLTVNEEAMTALEETTAAIAAMQTTGTTSHEEYDSAILQLQEIAGNAHLYNRR
ncbi:hypothetical protein [Desulfogranum japonicum]|uniref:hypothetical protein n=1 Tax=Desulfogranum japonicum TaxID=231447 RepID=UPI00041A2520|nr:hypothetical protein [Desulfogranum japonicum]